MQASDAVNNNNGYVSQNISVTQSNTHSSEFKSLVKTTINPARNETDEQLVFELIEINEGEDEELSSGNKALYKDYLKLLFINATLFKNASKVLQKNNYRTQNDSIEPKLRLHVQFQVFII